MDTKSKIEIMQHYANGGEVERRSKYGLDHDKWWVSNEPLWDWHSQSYRIKVKEFSRAWAQQRYEQGEKVRKTIWSDEIYISNTVNNAGNTKPPSQWNEYHFESWEIFVEPPQPKGWWLIKVGKEQKEYVKWWSGTNYRTSASPEAAVYGRHASIAIIPVCPMKRAD